MILNLGQLRELFARLLPRLLDEAHRQGWHVRVGEVVRGPQQAEWNATHCVVCKGTGGVGHSTEHRFKPFGILRSVHRDGLAVDLILCSEGVPQWQEEAYTPLGEWWLRQDALCRWGGRFGDAGHFSLEYLGRQ